MNDITHSSGAGAAGGIGLVTVLLALIFLFVWPGPLRYEYSYRSVGVTRIDRLNGNVSLLQGGQYVGLARLQGNDMTLK